MTKRLIDIDDYLLTQARTILDTGTMRDTVNRALEEVHRAEMLPRHAIRLSSMDGPRPRRPGRDDRRLAVTARYLADKSALARLPHYEVAEQLQPRIALSLVASCPISISRFSTAHAMRLNMSRSRLSASSFPIS